MKGDGTTSISASHADARVWLEIRLSALQANYRQIAAAVSPGTVIGVLKADAYGMGVEPVADALEEAGCRYFGVADIHEACALAARPGLRVQILGSVLPDEMEPALRAGIIVPCGDWETAEALRAAVGRTGVRARAHLLVDSGMGRLGVPLSEAASMMRAVAPWPEIEWEGIYSHFPIAYRAGDAYSRNQVEGMRNLLQALEAEGIRFAWRHMANSDAVHNVPESYQAPFNAVRTGINLYGSFDPEGSRRFPLQQVVSLKTRLAAVRTLPEGSCIGYGCTYRLPRQARVGTIAAGYADGVPMALTNRGYVLIRGIPCPILGRVSMDYTTIALDGVPDARCGEEVVCLGGEGPSAITPEHWAQLKGTHAYDILCSFGRRVKRCYV